MQARAQARASVQADASVRERVRGALLSARARVHAFAWAPLRRRTMPRCRARRAMSLGKETT
eukprot:4739840-Pleurochrysis_carterae.AAC.1